jgi:16S rRNA (cytosine967-C5)-methyltransferase
MAAVRRGVKRPARPEGRWALLEQLIGEVLVLSQPADAVISRFFRERPQIGSRDRGFLAEAAWNVLRNRSWFAHLAGSGSGSMNRRLAILAVDESEHRGGAMRDANLGESELDWLERVRMVASTAQVPPALRQSMPPWIMERLEASLGSEGALECASFLRQPAPLDLRVNLLLATPEQALAQLAEDGLEVHPLSVLPEALRVSGKPNVSRTKAFEKGWIEVQDLGSQILARLASPRRGEFIVDLCAGAGGKTLAMGASLRNTGRLYALDTSAARLARLKPRLARSGLSNVWPCAISGLSDDRVRRLSRKADVVFVDAPCSGLGTLRRNPDLKWRFDAASVARLAQQQLEILAAGVRLLKPGGRLVYGTCSLLPEENQAVVDACLLRFPGLQRVDCKALLERQRLVIPPEWEAFTPQGDLMLWPQRTGTDGFFGAVLVMESSGWDNSNGVLKSDPQGGQGD